MKKSTEEENHLLTLLVTGQCQNELDVNKAIEFLTQTAQKNPQSFLATLEEVVEIGINGMVMVALAIFASTAEETFLQENNSAIIMLLSEYGPPKLLEFVELQKSKVFGRGYGSRSQKWVREVMESWSPKTLNYFITKYPKEFYSLTMITHPRYSDICGRLVRNFLKTNKK